MFYYFYPSLLQKKKFSNLASFCSQSRHFHYNSVFDLNLEIFLTLFELLWFPVFELSIFGDFLHFLTVSRVISVNFPANFCQLPGHFRQFPDQILAISWLFLPFSWLFLSFLEPV